MNKKINEWKRKSSDRIPWWPLASCWAKIWRERSSDRHYHPTTPWPKFEQKRNWNRERKRKEERKKREKRWNWERDLDEIVFGGSVAGGESGRGKGRALLIIAVFATGRGTHNHFLFFLLLHRIDQLFSYSSLTFTIKILSNIIVFN